MSRTLLTLALFVLASHAAQEPIPAYVKQCQLSSPKLEECLKDSLHHARPYLAKGIPEIQFPTVEPFVIDSLSLTLGGGNEGYKVILKDVNVYGISTYTANSMRLSKGNQPFEVTFKLPKLELDANYTDSGRLLVIPASGSGRFHCTVGNVVVVLRGAVKKSSRKGKDYLSVEKLDFDIPTLNGITMHVTEAHKNNKILLEATNLFMRENAREVLDVMMPQLKVKLANVIKKAVNHLFSRTPVQTIVKP